MLCIFLKDCYLHFYKILLLEANNLNLKPFPAMDALGTGLHFLIGAPLYEDIKPFYPIMTKTLYKPSLALDIYVICIWIGVFGIVYYFWTTRLNDLQKTEK